MKTIIMWFCSLVFLVLMSAGFRVSQTQLTGSHL